MGCRDAGVEADARERADLAFGVAKNPIARVSISARVSGPSRGRFRHGHNLYLLAMTVAVVSPRSKSPGALSAESYSGHTRTLRVIFRCNKPRLGRTRSLAGSNGPLSTMLRRFSFASLVSGGAPRGSSFQPPDRIVRLVSSARGRTQERTYTLVDPQVARAGCFWREPGLHQERGGQTGVSPPAGSP